MALSLHVSLKSVFLLITDMDKNRMEVPWFFERGVSLSASADKIFPILRGH